MFPREWLLLVRRGLVDGVKREGYFDEFFSVGHGGEVDVILNLVVFRVILLSDDS